MTQLMTESEIKQLLAIAMAYDNRKPGESAVLAWGEAAKRAGWTYERAVEAVHTHYARSTAFIMPGHVTELVRAQSRQPAPAREVVRLEAAPPATEETRSRFAALIRETFAMPSRLRDRPGRTRERRPQRGSADDLAARERARRELDAIRDRRLEPPDDVVG